jgi:prolycopene isomerase
LKYDAIIIGGGLFGLTAASLLAKRGPSVAVVERSYNPGGSCGIFKSSDVSFDQGAAMLYGFGEKGFNAHRFIFNCLEEPVDMIWHDLLYCVNFEDARKCWLQNPADCNSLEKYETPCICAIEYKSDVEIQAVIDYLQEVNV